MYTECHPHTCTQLEVYREHTGEERRDGRGIEHGEVKGGREEEETDEKME